MRQFGHILFSLLLIFSTRDLNGQTTLLVTSTSVNSSGNCSTGCTFSQAMNNYSSGDTIKIADSLSFDIIRSFQPQVIDKDLTIIGSGIDNFAFVPDMYDGGIPYFFEVDSGVTLVLIDLSIKLGGNNSQFYSFHGAIYNKGNLYCKNVLFTNNGKDSGGAIYNAGSALIDSSIFLRNSRNAISNFGDLEVSNSLFEQNQPFGAINSSGRLVLSNCEFINNTGGAVSQNGHLKAYGCEFIDNVTTGNGGGISISDFNSDSTSIIKECTFIRNESLNQTFLEPNYSGGGGLITDGRTLIDGCTFYDNYSETIGGAITSSFEDLYVYNTTISQNRISNNRFWGGGGIFYDNFAPWRTGDPPNGRITNCTFLGNESGGLVIGEGYIELGNSLIINNERGPAPFYSGQLISLGNNFIDDTTYLKLSANPPNDILGQVLDTNQNFLAPIDDNGGPTLTHALLLDSLGNNIAIRKFFSGDTSLLGNDQRGFPTRGARDIGAFEYQETHISSPKIIMCVEGDYLPLGDILFIDSTGGGIKVGNNYEMIFGMPQGFELKPEEGSITSLSPDIQIKSYSITNSTISFTYDKEFRLGYNEIKLSGLQIKALGNKIGDGKLVRVAGSGVVYGNRVIDSVSHATFITNGSVPEADFDWKFNCLGDQTELVDLSTISSGTLDYWNWNLGDNAISSVSAPIHTFSDTGTFSIQLIVGPDSVCTDTLSEELFVLPVISPTPSDTYFEDFEDGKGGWFTEGNPSSSWHWTPAQGFNISDSSNRVWMTGKGGAYFSLEDSWVNSPCFDLSNLRNPIIKLDSWSDSELNFDGAILQSSTDGGFTWNTLGSYANELSSGVNWYNNLLTAGDPVFQFGWTGQEDQSWKSSRHSLALLEGGQSVKFRMAFASDASQPVGSNLDGFAFDNVSIGEQKGNVLLEHFTNLNSPQNNESLQSLDNLIGEYASTLIPIQYHTAYPQADNIYAANPAIPQSRALFYKVDQTNHMIIEGNGFNGSALGVDDNALNRNILNDERFTVEILPLDLLAGEQANVEVRLSPKIPIVGRQLILQTILVEKNRREGSKDLQNIARKMLPNPAGVLLKEDWSRASEEFIQHPFSRGGLPNLDNLGIIAFVQDQNSGEILGTDYRDADNFTTNINQELNEQNQIKIHPNPATNRLHIESTLEGNKFKVSNIWGEILLKGALKSNQKTHELDLSNLPPGIYSFSIQIQDRGIQSIPFLKL